MCMSAALNMFSSLQVTEAGEPSLPLWLQFDEKRLVFKGVPSSSDVGHLYICIKAIGKQISWKCNLHSC